MSPRSLSTITAYLTLPLLFLLLSSVPLLQAQSTASPAAFIENRGQWEPQVRFRLQLDGVTMWITDASVVYDLSRRIESPLAWMPSLLFKSADDRPMPSLDTPEQLRGHVIRTTFAGAAESRRASGEQEMEGRYNYFIGSDASRWGRNCRAFASVRLTDVYDGIDVVYYLDKGMPRYDLIIAPGADVARVRMMIDGADDVRAVVGGRLAIGTSLGDMEMRELISYQMNEKGERCQVGSRFLVEDDVVRFDVDAYDRSKPLVVDPIVFLTYFGSTGMEWIDDMVIDADGSVIIAGSVQQVRDGFPTTPGAYDTTLSGGSDGFVARLSADGTRLLFSTIIGGGGGDGVGDVLVAPDGSIYLTGGTGEDTLQFPTTGGTVGERPLGESDVFITRLGGAGDTLLLSTLFGAEGNEGGSNIGLRSDGSIVVAGIHCVTGNLGDTVSVFPTTDGAYDTSHNGWSDLFVVALGPNADTVLFCTLIGGGSSETLEGFHLGSDGSILLAGSTSIAGSDEQFPTTRNAFDRTHEGYQHPYVTKLSPMGDSLIFSTFIGGRGGWSFCHGMTADSAGRVYVTGRVSYEDYGYPTTPGAFDRVQNNFDDIIVTALSADGGELIFSTFIGTDRRERADDIAVDGEGNVYIVGLSDHLSYPTTPGAIDSPYHGIFLTVVSPDGRHLRYSTFLGGSGYGTEVELGPDGSVYVAGMEAGGFVATEGAYDREANANDASDLFIAKLSFALSSVESTGLSPLLPLDLR